MKRRTYLATATALAFAGCTGANDDDPDNGTANDTDNGTTDGNGTDDGMSDGTDDGSDDGTDDGDDDREAEEIEADGEAETFDDFEDLSQWEAVAGSLSADEDRSYAGSQSALLEADASDERVRIVRELDQPVDLTEVRPGMAVAADGTAHPLIQLIDEDGDRIDFRQLIHGGADLVPTNFGIQNVVGDPDLSRVVEIQVGYWVGDGDGSQFWIDDLHFLPRPDTGKVLVKFDGGYETAYTEAFPVMEEYGLPASTFVSTDLIREEEDHDGDRLTVDQLAELDDAGWTIGSHGSTHVNPRTLSSEEKEAHVRDAKEWLEDHGYEDGARYYTYPLAKYDAETLDLVGEHHDLGFAGSYASHGHAANPSLCSQMSDPSAEEARQVLDWTVEMGGITTLAYYQLQEGTRGEFEAAMEHLHDLESAGEVDVILPEDVAENYVL